MCPFGRAFTLYLAGRPSLMRCARRASSTFLAGRASSLYPAGKAFLICPFVRASFMHLTRRAYTCALLGGSPINYVSCQRGLPSCLNCEVLQSVPCREDVLYLSFREGIHFAAFR